MKRRSFLKTSFVGAAALTIPSWLGCAFGTGTKGELTDSDGFSKGSPLARAFLKAQSNGKPLLVFVVPPLPFDDEKLEAATDEQRNQQYAAYDLRRQRGYAFGELLNYGSDEQLWPLALCEVICALPAEISALTGNFSGAPLMALLETNTASPKALPLDGKLLDIPEGGFNTYIADGDNAAPPDPDKITKERMALLAKLYTAALAPNDKEMKQRAEQCRERFGEEEKTLEKTLGDNTTTAAQADQMAGILAQRAAEKPKEQKNLRALLALATKERLCKKKIEGSRWANSSGCGVTYEDPEPATEVVVIDGVETTINLSTVVVVGCGMGHIPEKSQRFLSFYANESDT